MVIKEMGFGGGQTNYVAALCLGFPIWTMGIMRVPNWPLTFQIQLDHTHGKTKIGPDLQGAVSK